VSTSTKKRSKFEIQFNVTIPVFGSGFIVTLEGAERAERKIVSFNQSEKMGIEKRKEKISLTASLGDKFNWLRPCRSESCGC
jgi:hypothetical protein